MNYFKILEKNVKGYPETFYVEFLIREDMVELENMGHPRMKKIISVNPVIKKAFSDWHIVENYLIGIVVDVGDAACADDHINYGKKGDYYYWPDAKDNIILIRRANDGKGNRRTWWRMTESGNTEFPV